MVEEQDISLLYSHKYIENTTICGTIHTENLQKKNFKIRIEHEKHYKTRQDIKKEEEEKKKQKEMRRDLLSQEGAGKRNMLLHPRMFPHQR